MWVRMLCGWFVGGHNIKAPMALPLYRFSHVFGAKTNGSSDSYNVTRAKTLRSGKGDNDFLGGQSDKYEKR
jgi:hypothetical protein